MAAAAAAETAGGGYCEGVLCLLCVLELCGTAGAAAAEQLRETYGIVVLWGACCACCVCWS